MDESGTGIPMNGPKHSDYHSVERRRNKIQSLGVFSVESFFSDFDLRRIRALKSMV